MQIIFQIQIYHLRIASFSFLSFHFFNKKIKKNTKKFKIIAEQECYENDLRDTELIASTIGAETFAYRLLS